MYLGLSNQRMCPNKEKPGKNIAVYNTLIIVDFQVG